MRADAELRRMPMSPAGLCVYGSEMRFGGLAATRCGGVLASGLPAAHARHDARTVRMLGAWIHAYTACFLRICRLHMLAITPSSAIASQMCRVMHPIGPMHWKRIVMLPRVPYV